jgi:hypothetical protein
VIVVLAAVAALVAGVALWAYGTFLMTDGRVLAGLVLFAVGLVLAAAAVGRLTAPRTPRGTGRAG